MADSTGKDPKASETTSGAVKPPVLDLKARPSVATTPSGADTSKPATPASSPVTPAASAATPGAKPGEKPADKPASKADTKPTPASSPSAAREKSSAAATPVFGAMVGAAVVGGLLGLGGAYGLAVAGLWPVAPSAAPVADSRLAEFGRAIPELETVTQTTQSELARASERLTALEQASSQPVVAADTADASTLATDLASLSARVDGLASATPAAGSDAGAIEALRTDLAGLTTRLDEVAARVGSSEAGLRALEGTVSATSATLAEQPSDIGAVLQLPLILSGLETAFASGRPYETELAALRAGLPQTNVPTAIANNAATGLPRPDSIARRLDSVLPAMLAGRPVDPNAGWQTGALDWFAGVIALQPSGEIEGDSPDAILSRLVGAVARRDFTVAKGLLESLPAPMQAAAEDVPALIGEQAIAQEFLQSLRSQALSGEVAQ
jgi:hypothetical protein